MLEKGQLWCSTKGKVKKMLEWPFLGNNGLPCTLWCAVDLLAGSSEGSTVIARNALRELGEIDETR